MTMQANSSNNSVVRRRDCLARRLAICGAFVFLSLGIRSAAAAPEDDVRTTFDHFVIAQNAHDVKAVESLLLGSPNFLWITRGTPVWGPEAALRRFAALYEGTWRLEPEASGLKVTMIGDGAAQVYVPIVFTIGAAGQQPQPARFLMNMILTKTADAWKVSSILPIPAPTP
jgi:ketosteroid isomerase-like protein